MKVEDKNLSFLFLRALVSKQYEKVNNSKKKMAFMADALSEIITQNSDEYEGLSSIFKSKIFQSKSDSVNSGHLALEKYLKGYLHIPNAMKILFNCQKIIGPLSLLAVEENRSESKKIQEIAMDKAKRDLNANGDDAILNLISDWSSYTLEASQVLKDTLGHDLVEKIELGLEKSEHPLSQDLKKQCANSALALFHARSTQGGKKSAGDGLELSARCILEHIGKKLEEVPQHITGILEADHVIKKGGSFGRMILISCKTTARERYKQVLVENRDTLEKLKISRIIWFFRDCDLSHEECRQLGLRGSIIYLPDNSYEFKKFIDNPTTKKYVRPISKIRETLDNFFDPSFEP